MAKRAWGTISLGVFLLTCALSAFAYHVGAISLCEIIPALLILNGAWLLIMAALKRSVPKERGMGASLVAGWSAVLFASGLFLILWWRISIAAALVALFAAMGAIAILAGLAMQKKPGK
ncbi:MAG: hypothetical protein QW567_02350 [Candidatus Hadarchaeales archaeon]